MSGASFGAKELPQALQQAGETVDLDKVELEEVAGAAIRAARDGREFTEEWAEVS